MALDAPGDYEADPRDVEMDHLLVDSSEPSTAPRNAKSPTPAAHRPTPMSLKILACLLCLSLLASHWVAPMVLPDVIRKASSLNGSTTSSSESRDAQGDSGSSDSSSSSSASASAEEYIPKTYDARLGTTCPDMVDDENDSGVGPWYDSKSSDISKNASEYLRFFQQVGDYDNWGHSYQEISKGMRHFKTKYLLPNLADNTTLFESSCGRGLGLYMTLELLSSTAQNVVIYGSDTSADSVRVANQLLNSGRLPGQAQFGLICQADANRLQYIPDNSMDLVYSGYIPPLADPLGLNIENPNQLFARYAELCEAKPDVDPADHQLSIDAQHKQNAWYRMHVDELIRIAKPGAPILVEQVSYPLCDVLYDGGGVYQSFWQSNIEFHGWDIDPKSIEFLEDTIFRRRYHVFMRKNRQ